MFNFREKKRLKRKNEILSVIAESEVLQMLALIISIRGEFMYYLAHKVSENANKPDFVKLYANEQKLLKKELILRWKDKTASEIETLIRTFYGK